MSLAWRIRLLLLAFFALLCVNASLALMNVQEGQRAQDEFERISLTRNAVNLLLNSLVEQETATRGYVLTRDDAFLGASREARVATVQLEERVEQLLREDTSLGGNLEQMLERLAEWRVQAEREIEAASVGDLDAAAAMAVEGHRLSQDLRLDVQQLRTALEGRYRAANLRLQHNRQRLTTVLFSSFGAGAALLLAAGLLLRRWITVPLRRVSAAVSAVAEGDLARSVPEVGPVDVAMLGGDVERMRRRIIDELETAVRAGEALEQHGPAVASLHSELAPVRVELPGTVEVAARLLPAEGQIAGDWYDLIPLERGKVALVVVDVSGHGPDASVLALRAKQLLLASLRDGRSPGGTLDWVASNLGETGEMFLTAAVVEVNPALRRCRYANAGHPPLLLATSDGVTELAPTGPLLGPLSSGWATEEYPLDRGAVLVAYTDGLVEARDETGREFGTERLINLVAARRAGGPERVAAACIDAVRSSTDGRLVDDLTIVALALR